MLCDELDKLGQKNELTAGSLETADKLSHALKNVQKIIKYYEEMGDGEYSRADGWGGTTGGSYARGGRGGRRGGRTGSNQYGSYTRGYSRAEGTENMVMELRELMNEAPNENIKHRMHELISEIEMM